MNLSQLLDRSETSEVLLDNQSVSRNTSFTMAAHSFSQNENYSWIRIASAIVLLLIFICSLCLNSILLHLLRTKNIFLMKGNRFIGCLLTVELLVQILGLPLVISSMFADRWLFGRFGCVFYAFLMTWLGSLTILLLSVISIERFLIVFPKHPMYITRRMAIIITSLCTTYGLAWAISPYSGWTEYVFEPSGVSCTPSWAPEYSTFVITIFTSSFIVPFTFMTLCYGTILWKVRDVIHTVGNSKVSDRELSKTMLLIMGCFLLCWLPYAIFAGLGTFGVDMSHVPVEVTYIPLACAKTAGLLHPIIYGLKNSALRNELFVAWKTLSIRRNRVSLSSDVIDNGSARNCELVGAACTGRERGNLPVVLHVASNIISNTIGVCTSNLNIDKFNDTNSRISNRCISIFSIDTGINLERTQSSYTSESLTPRSPIVETFPL